MPALCTLAMMPMRETPSHRSQMVNVVLFGDVYDILHQEGDWLHTRLAHDGYEGWVNCRKPQIITEDFAQRLEAEQPAFLYDNILVHGQFSCTFGSRLPFYRNGHISLGDAPLNVNAATGPAFSKEAIAPVAMRFLNTPYLWGGRSLLGIDCSGLTQMVMKLCGVKLPRDAWQQEMEGEEVDGLTNSRAGDLAFFSDREDGRITHVGILTGRGTVIHASEWVREDRIDENGIYLTHLERYGMKAVRVKRYFS